MKSWFVLFLFILLGSLSAKAEWIASTSRAPGVPSFLKAVESKIPVHMAKILGAVKVDFSDSFKELNLNNSNLNYASIGRRDLLVARNRIILSSQLLRAIAAGKAHSEFQTAEKALTFQLAVMLDRSDRNWDNKIDQSEVLRCHRQHPKEKGRVAGVPGPVCRYYLNSSYKISDALNYRSLADYKGLRQESKNDFVGRVGNTSELSSVHAHFALNLTTYLTDTDYECRRPALAQFFSELTQSQQKINCEKVTTIFSSSGGWKFDVDPRKVYQVHFLFASKGEEMMSRWGHSMLRLVVCAPERVTVGPECLEDVAFHIVLSYRANVDDVIVNYWDGLSGKYPSQLMVFPLSQIVDEYARGQWRDLISLPIKLTEKQQSVLVKSALEHYWSYSGSYKFITNNCATEADQLVRAALPKNHPYQNSMAMTPLGMYQNLSTFKLTDENLVVDREKAKGVGYLFPSQKESLDKSFEKIKGLFPKFKDLSDLALASYASDRRAVYEKFEALDQIGAGYLVEKHIQLMNQRVLQNLVSQSLQSDTALGDRELREVIEKLVNASQGRLPWEYATLGYGIPLANELVPEEEVSKRYREGSQWGAQYSEILLKRFPEMSEELDQIKDNMKLLANLRRF